MRIDAHQHYWNIERLHYPILSPEAFGDQYRTIEPPELAPYLHRHGIDATVVVQAKDALDETKYLLELAEQYDTIAGVVGWVDLADSALAAKQLETFAHHPKFVGVRHLIMVHPDPDWVIRPEVIEGLRVLASFGLPFDLGAEFPKHLHHAVTIAEQVPDLKMIIDHLAKPPLEDDEGMAAWRKQIEQAAAYPHVYAKISGLHPSAMAGSAIETAYRLFGADRLMFGSDWPVVNFASSFDEVWQVVNEAVSMWSDTERKMLFGGTAQQVYNLQKLEQD